MPVSVGLTYPHVGVQTECVLRVRPIRLSVCSPKPSYAADYNVCEAWAVVEMLFCTLSVPRQVTGFHSFNETQ